MRIAMIGTGYVGLVSGVCFSDFGHEVVCVDTNAEKIARLEAGTTVLPDVTAPGAFVGEVGALLDRPRSATILARGPATVRVIGDPTAFFATHPELALELARQLAGRLQRLTAYLADVREQYADHEGHLGMVDAVLGRLAARPPVDIEPGSDRSPDY